jgi:ribosome-associated protein
MEADDASAGTCVTGVGNVPREQAATDVATRALIAARAADAKKGDDIIVLDVGDIIGIVECFVITSASNTRLVRTIVEEVERQVFEQTGEKPRAVEGLRDASWVLLDYGDLVVHVFLAETREFYGLERLWADADRLEWADSATAS